MENLFNIFHLWSVRSFGPLLISIIFESLFVAVCYQLNSSFFPSIQFFTPNFNFFVLSRSLFSRSLLLSRVSIRSVVWGSKDQEKCPMSTVRQPISIWSGIASNYPKIHSFIQFSLPLSFDFTAESTFRRGNGSPFIHILKETFFLFGSRLRPREAECSSFLFRSSKDDRNGLVATRMLNQSLNFDRFCGVLGVISLNSGNQKCQTD